MALSGASRRKQIPAVKRECAAIWAISFKSGADRLHRNLLITGNEIIGFPGSAICLRDVQNAVVRDNTITPAPSGQQRIEPIMLRNTDSVQVEKNTIRKTAP